MAVEIIEFKPLDKGALRGFLAVRLVKLGLEIYDIALFEKGGGKWINLTRREYVKKDGTKGYQELVRFTERAVHDQFQAEVLAALGEFQKKEPPADEDMSIPF